MPQPAAKSSSKGLIIALSALLVLAALAAGGWFYLQRRTVEQLPAQATAQIGPAQASIFKGPDFRDVIVTLRQGDTVNVIRPPKSKTDEWTEVQFVGEKPLPRGLHPHQ